MFLGVDLGESNTRPRHHKLCSAIMNFSLRVKQECEEQARVYKSLLTPYPKPESLSLITYTLNVDEDMAMAIANADSILLSSHPPSYEESHPANPVPFPHRVQIRDRGVDFSQKSHSVESSQSAVFRVGQQLNHRRSAV